MVVTERVDMKRYLGGIQVPASESNLIQGKGKLDLSRKGGEGNDFDGGCPKIDRRRKTNLIIMVVGKRSYVCWEKVG